MQQRRRRRRQAFWQRWLSALLRIIDSRSARRSRTAPPQKTVPEMEMLRTEEQRRRASRMRRDKRRREQQRQLLIRGGAVLVIVIVIFTLVHKKQQPVVGDDWANQSIIAVNNGEDQQQNLTMEETIRQNPEDYTDSLLELLNRNPETVQFIYDYPAQHSLTHQIDLTKELEKGGIPLFIQWDERWGYETYGSDMIAITGCGPTCLSMVLCGTRGTGDWTPLRVAQYADQHGYYVEGSGTAWNLMTEGAKDLGLSPQTMTLKDSAIQKQLEAGNPIICSMGPGDFTDVGHYIVLVGVYDDGTIEIRDPNSPKRSAQHWKLSDLTKQMKTLWYYQV